jgi:hypothetical protein
MRGFFSSPAGAPARGSSPARPVRLLSALALAALFSFGQQARVEAADLALERMEVVGGEVPQLVLFLSDAAQGSAVSSYPQTQPDRVVVELAGTITNMGVSQVAGDGVLVDRAEVISFDDGTGPTTRVTLYLNRPGAEVQPLVVSDGNRVVVSLNPVRSAGEATAEATPRERNPRDLSGPERVPTGPALTSLDFESLDEVSRVVIGLKDTREYTVTQSQGNLILVDIPGTFLPQSLQRVLDTGDFVSPVRMVRAYKTGRGTRVAISLRRETTYEHTITDRGLLVLDIAATVVTSARAGPTAGSATRWAARSASAATAAASIRARPGAGAAAATTPLRRRASRPASCTTTRARATCPTRASASASTSSTPTSTASSA